MQKSNLLFAMIKVSASFSRQFSVNYVYILIICISMCLVRNVMYLSSVFINIMWKHN